MGGDGQMGTVAIIVVGIVGALVDGLTMNFVGAAGASGFNLYSLLVAFVGAVVTLFLFGLVQRPAWSVGNDKTQAPV